MQKDKKLFAKILTIIISLQVLMLGAAAPTYAAAKEVKIGFALSLTGAAAVYGAAQKNGASLAIAQINAAAGNDGFHILPLYEDDASTPQQGINVFNKFINGDKVSLIIGPTLSNTAKVADRLAQKAGTPVLAISNTAPGITDIGDFIFRDSLTEMIVIPHTLKVAQEKLGLKKVAMLYGNDDAYTKGGYEAFKKALQDNGIKIISEQTFAKGDRDFSPQLTQIKAQNPEAIIVSALVEEASGIVNQARQLGIPPQVRIIGGNGFNSPLLIKNAGQHAEGVIVGAAWNAAATNLSNRRFVEDYTRQFGTAPDQFAAQAFAGVHIVYQAVKMANSTDRSAIREALTKINNMDTVLGNFSFTASRDADNPPVVQEVKGGKFVIFGN
jgi:branched-chain amino acid transport system substrate-binding protein